ncbi:type II secretion system secretin GspD [Granulosicoccus antarcticus]|uniref:Type II secretion system protein D n=1 Tax=Granulosicoccus antarcticus IMCC3135 TaxID=1192854 RepID=A0A2Z2NNG3_9GAMM|nr:type II secretion system secretin GspD [Granulosicoccus antarcticus]ASJ71278.1 Type II secretion system protein D [Granulosicoccus antarcticus IMCC3135]
MTMFNRHYPRVIPALALRASFVALTAVITGTVALTGVVTPVQAQEGTFTLNLKNADIHSLIQTVSRQSGRNFVVDPRVKARVTVISSAPLNSDELYETFLSVLQVHGYAAVPSGDLIKIVPDVNAKQGPVPAYSDENNNSDQLVTQVIKVENVPAAQLVPILRPLVPQQGHLAAYASTNTLIVTDRASNIHRLIDIINGIDRPDNDEVEVVRLSHASASEVIRIVQSLQSRSGQVDGTPGSVRFAADERTNSILLSGDPAARTRMRGTILNLDTPVESGGNTRVVYLRFANAADLLAILTGVSAGQAQIGTSGDLEGGAATPAAAPDGAAAQVPTASLIRRATQDDGPSVDIQADEDTNALIITAAPDEMRSILAVVEQLDIRRAQVLVEAIIAELSTDNSSQLGVNFAVNGTDSDRPAAYTNLGGATQALIGTIASEGTSLSSGLSLLLGRAGSNGIDFGFLLSAIASDTDNNILSTPTLVTMDNQEAEIVVGQNVPFVTGQQLSSSNDNPFQTIERQDIGISLKVKPQINEGDNIKMEIEQEVSDVSATAVTGATDITTNKRSIKTTVLVEDGQTLVLGGLIDDQIEDTRSKVPFLGDIPLLGSLFRYRTSSKSKRNLMVFLHPTILRDPETADFYSRSKYDDLRGAQLGLFDQDKNFNDDDRPDLPELHLYFDGKRVSRQGAELGTILPTSDASDLLAPQPDTTQPALDEVLDTSKADTALTPRTATLVR